MLLATLVKRGPLRQSELATCSFLDPSTISRHVAHLVRTQLVERRPDPADGRAVQLVPTVAGLRAYDRLAEQRDKWLAEVLSTWDPADTRLLVDLMRRLNDTFSHTVLAHLPPSAAPLLFPHQPDRPAPSEEN